MFNHESKLHKYGRVEEIIEDFYQVRINAYQKRKANQIKDMENKLVKLSNRARYIKENLDGVVDLRRKSAIDVVALMETRKFDKIDGDYKYLIKMPMDSVTTENAQHIMQERDVCEKELATLRGTSLETMWLSELDNLEREYSSYKTRRAKIQAGSAQPTKTIKKAGGSGGARKK
jgi:DNA topoisomerase-2